MSKNDNLIFTEEEKYVIKGIIENPDYSKGDSIKDFIATYKSDPDLDNDLNVLLSGIEEKISGYYANYLETLLENMDWNTVFDE